MWISNMKIQKFKSFGGAWNVDKYIGKEINGKTQKRSFKICDKANDIYKYIVF